MGSKAKGFKSVDLEMFNAISKNDFLQAEEIIKKGANINVVLPGIEWPLILVFIESKNYSAVKFLIDIGVDVNQTINHSTFGQLPIILQAREDEEIFDYFLTNGAKTDSDLSYNAGIFLLYAIPTESLTSIKNLLKLRPNLDIKTSKGRNAFDIANDIGRADVVKLLKGHK